MDSKNQKLVIDFRQAILFWILLLAAMIYSAPGFAGNLDHGNGRNLSPDQVVIDFYKKYLHNDGNLDGLLSEQYVATKLMARIKKSEDDFKKDKEADDFGCDADIFMRSQDIPDAWKSPQNRRALTTFYSEKEGLAKVVFVLSDAGQIADKNSKFALDITLVRENNKWKVFTVSQLYDDNHQPKNQKEDCPMDY